MVRDTVSLDDTSFNQEYENLDAMLYTYNHLEEKMCATQSKMLKKSIQAFDEDNDGLVTYEQGLTIWKNQLKQKGIDEEKATKAYDKLFLKYGNKDTQEIDLLKLEADPQ